VATFSGTVIAGARGDDGACEDPPPQNCDSGAAYVFLRAGGDWDGPMKKILPSDPAPEDLFGSSVAIHVDTALVGSPGDDDDGLGSGSAYTFLRTGGTWPQEAKLVAADSSPGDRFGISVSLFSNLAVVGADRTDDACPFSFCDSGSAYVFLRTGGAWGQQAELKGSFSALGDHFGQSVALEDGTAVVGAPDRAGSRGSAYVFLVPDGAEQCADAHAITGKGTFAFDNIGASTDGLAHPSCQFPNANQLHSDIWYLWSAECTTDVTVATCGGTTLDTSIAVYERLPGDTCPPPTARLLVCDDNLSPCGPGGLQTEVVFPAVAGNVYLIRLGSTGLVAQAAGTFTIDYLCPLCPAQTLTSQTASYPPYEAARTLRRLYRVRDRVLRGAPRGERWIELYYEHADALGRILRADPQLRRRVSALLALLGPGFDALAEGGGGDVRVPAHALVLLDSVLRSIEEQDAGGRLAAALRAEREALELVRIAGRSYAEVWGEVNAEPAGALERR
jgi:hypothetical protein